MSRNIRPNRAGAGAYQPPSASRYEEYEDDYPSSTRYLSRDRDQQPPPASSRAAVLGRGDRGQQDYASGRYGQTLSTGSTASTTSSGSSLLDRMKVRSYESSRTSLDDDREAPRQQNNPTWARKPGALRTQIREEREQVAPVNDPSSAGNTLWDRVVTAAGSLTINVSKAWEGGVGDGPETPPGGETRLTKAMKDYYIQRARSPLDLPHWLFEEHERMPTAARHPPRDARSDGAARRGGGNRYDEYEEQPTSPPPRGGILRDVYDRAAVQPTRTTPVSQSNRSTPASHGYDSSPATTESKATSRLRALRDAKRMQGAGAAAATYTNRYDEDYSTNDGSRRSMDPVSDTERRTPSSRTGLPSRPGASRYT